MGMYLIGSFVLLYLFEIRTSSNNTTFSMICREQRMRLPDNTISNEEKRIKKLIKKSFRNFVIQSDKRKSMFLPKSLTAGLLLQLLIQEKELPDEQKKNLFDKIYRIKYNLTGYILNNDFFVIDYIHVFLPRMQTEEKVKKVIPRQKKHNNLVF